MNIQEYLTRKLWSSNGTLTKMERKVFNDLAISFPKFQAYIVRKLMNEGYG